MPLDSEIKEEINEEVDENLVSESLFDEFANADKNIGGIHIKDNGFNVIIGQSQKFMEGLGYLRRIQQLFEGLQDFRLVIHHQNPFTPQPIFPCHMNTASPEYPRTRSPGQRGQPIRTKKRLLSPPILKVLLRPSQEQF